MSQVIKSLPFLADEVAKPAELAENEKSDQPKEVAKAKSKRPAVYTIDRAAMLEEVGITPKMLREWQERGWFQAELGKGARRFTAADVTRLSYIKHLRQDLGISADGVERLLSPFALTREEPHRTSGKKKPVLAAYPMVAYPFIDVATGQLMGQTKVLMALIDRDIHCSQGEGDKLEDWLIRVAVNVFSTLSWKLGSNPRRLDAARAELFERLKDADLAARLTITHEDIAFDLSTGQPSAINTYAINPKAADDPEELTPELIDRLQLLRGWIARKAFPVFPF